MPRVLMVLVRLSLAGCFSSPPQVDTADVSQGTESTSDTSTGTSTSASTSTTLSTADSSSASTNETSSGTTGETTGDAVFEHVITIRATEVASPLADVPVLLRLRPDAIEVDAVAMDGSDLRVEDESGELVPLEVDVWDPFTGGDVWIRVPVVDDQPHDMRLRYGDPNLELGPEPPQVWSNDYVAVFHLSSPVDSTGYAHDAAQLGGTAAEGWIGEALRFSVVADAFVVDDAPDLALESGFTLEAWVNPGTVTALTTHHGVVEKGSNYRLIAARTETDNPMMLVNVGGGEQLAEATSPLSTNEWTYLVGTFGVERAEPSRLRLFVDGQAVADVMVDPPLTASTVSLRIGADPFEGLIDEVRVSRTPRSEDWIRVQNASMRNDLVIIGPPA